MDALHKMDENYLNHLFELINTKEAEEDNTKKVLFDTEDSIDEDLTKADDKTDESVKDISKNVDDYIPNFKNIDNEYLTEMLSTTVTIKASLSNIRFNEETLVNRVKTDNNLVAILSNYGNIYYTTNGGNDWLKNDPLTDQHLNKVYFLNKQKGWIIGSGGLLLKYNNTLMNDDHLNEADNYFKIFPNPFNKRVHIQCLKDANILEIIEIININGVVLERENRVTDHENKTFLP